MWIKTTDRLPELLKDPTTEQYGYRLSKRVLARTAEGSNDWIVAQYAEYFEMAGIPVTPVFEWLDDNNEAWETPIVEWMEIPD